jgi:hypothetical protein
MGCNIHELLRLPANNYRLMNLFVLRPPAVTRPICSNGHEPSSRSSMNRRPLYLPGGSIE